MLLPSLRLVLLLGVPAVLAWLAFFDASLLRLVLWADAAILVLVIGDVLSVLRPRVGVAREAPEVLSVGRPNPIRLVVRSRSRRPLRVRVNDDLFEGAESEGLPVELELPAHGAAAAEYRVIPRRRGAYELGAHTVRYPSLLGLFWRQLRVDERHAVRVYPDLIQVGHFELLARQNREFELVRATRRRGGESEFARLRDYARDDEYRSLDWKATARRQKLIVREYQIESNQQVLFLLDAGRAMTAEVHGLTQFDHALNAALMLGHVAARTGDQVGLVAFDTALRAFVSPTGGPGASTRLVRAAYDLQPRLVESDYESALHEVGVRQRKRALVVLFTQVLDDTVARTLLAGCRVLGRQHLPLVVLFRDLDVEALLEPVTDDRRELYVRGAAAEVLRWRRGLVRDLRHGGALVLDVGPRELTGQLINHYLEIKSRHRL